MLGGRGVFSGSLTSYVMRMCASMAFSSLTAKKRPGLAKLATKINRDVKQSQHQNLTMHDGLFRM